MSNLFAKFGGALIVLLVINISFSQAQTVTNISATYQSGQVFITWKNVSAKNKKYRIYRSLEKINSTTRLNNSAYLGYVVDSSSKNIHKSQLKHVNTYFKINQNGSALDPQTGLYVVTSTDNNKWYYAVTTQDIATGSEDKTITMGTNSLTASVREHKLIPQPVLQATLDLGGGTTSYEYVIWGNDQSTSSMPAFNNAGSYGYNFTFIQHSLTEKSVYMLFRDDDTFSDANPFNCEDCNVLIMEDWLPNGSGTYWFGYNENYDMYSTNNPVQTTGVIRSYTQTRIKFILKWVTSNLSVDATQVYASGSSHNGFGALMASQLMPDLIAAEWLNVTPPIVKANDGSDWETVWCNDKSNLQTDVLNPVTGLPMNIWNVFDMRTMFVLNYQRGLPWISGVNGKQDDQIGWVQSLHWYDSLEYSHEGGAWYWDQRQHNGNGSQFLDEEIKPDYRRFSTAKSYPAFSYCSIDQNPGNGSKSSGDPYGAINGYLDWDDNSVSDTKCTYTIKCFIKDMYVNGVLQPQHDSCTTDLVMRRLQKFKPYIGTTIDWTVTRSNNQIAASGTIFYDGTPIALYGIPIYKSGSTISFHLEGCNKEDESASSTDTPFAFLRTADGYLVEASMLHEGDVEIRLVDLAGRIIMDEKTYWQAGTNEFHLKMSGGDYILQVISNDALYTRKLFF